MPKYALNYAGAPNFKTDEESAAFMSAWKAWSNEHGEKFVDKLAPFGKSKTVSIDGIVDGSISNPLSGVLFVETETVNEALHIAKTCPHVQHVGTIEVCEVLNLPL